MNSRRTFLVGCGGIVAAPAFARLSLPAGGPRELQVTAAEASVSAPPYGASAPESVALRIHGWDSPADSGSNVWVQINSSWRANWR